MDKQHPHRKYGFEDIEKYLQGQLSPSEMHAFEKAALQDPFLAEALEGYESSDLETVAVDLADINQRLGKPLVQAARVAPFLQRSWWKVAALFILVAGAGVVTWKLFSNDDGTVVTASAPIPAIQHTAPGTTGTQPIEDKQSKAARVEAKPPSKQTPPKIVEDTRENSMEAVRADEVAARTTHPRDTTSKQAATNIDVSRTLAGRVPGVSIDSKKEMDINIGALSGKSFSADQFPARQKDSTGKKIALTTQMASLSASITPPVPSATVATIQAENITSAGNFQASVHSDTPIHLNVVLTPSREALNEVVVSSYSPAAKKTVMSIGAQNIEKITGTTELAETVSIHPASGWPYLYTQLREKIRALKNPTSPVSGKISVKMTLDSNGKATDVSIIQSFDPSLQAITAEVIKQQTQWIVVPKQLVARTITFSFFLK